MLFRHALVPFIFRFRVRRLTNWISLQSSTSLGIINTPLRTHIVRMFDNGDIALDDLFVYIICGLVMLNGIKLRLCADLVDGRIEQIALARLQFLDRPVRTADIFSCGKLTVFIGIVFVDELFALENPVFCACKRGVSLHRSRLSVALGHGNGKLLQDIREIAGSDLIPLDGCGVKCLTFANADVAEFTVKNGSRITKCAVKDAGLPKGATIGGLIRNGEGILVTGNTVIQPNDHVVVFCLGMMIKKIEKFFN